MGPWWDPPKISGPPDGTLLMGPPQNFSPKNKKSGRKTPSTTPPRIYEPHRLPPPRNRAGKLHLLPPPRIYEPHRLPPPSKSGRKTPSTTPPLEFTNLIDIDYPPPRNRAGKLHLLPPPSNLRTSSTTPPLEIGPENSIYYPPPSNLRTSSTTPPLEIGPENSIYYPPPRIYEPHRLPPRFGPPQLLKRGGAPVLSDVQCNFIRLLMSSILEKIDQRRHYRSLFWPRYAMTQLSRMAIDRGRSLMLINTLTFPKGWPSLALPYSSFHSYSYSHRLFLLYLNSIPIKRRGRRWHGHPLSPQCNVM